MAISFPSSPSINQEYSYNDKAWRWNGTGWALTLGKPYGREVLTADRTYYVATTGSDSNNGLTVGTPFLTLQKAVDVVAGLDISICAVTIQAATGTYAPVTLFKIPLGSGSVTLKGDSVTPANCLITGAGAMVQASEASPITRLVDGFKLVSTSYAGLVATKLASLQFRNIDFGSCTAYHITASSGAVITAAGNYTISGNAAVHAFIEYAAIAILQSRIVTFVNAITLSSGFVISRQGSMVSAYGMTFAGTYASAIGPKYEVQTNAVIFVNGASVSYFPGNSAGASATGGQYG